jgi:predicted nucleic acid-binding protein/GNAT superfamily N-acetyltransferase
MIIEFIDQNSPFLKDVMDLGKKNSFTLGFMPEGGFVDHAIKKSIIIILNDTELVGYLMYRIVSVYSRITIVHLCIAKDHREKGLSTKLLDVLVEKYKATHIGISLRCRSDYIDPNKLWERYGFICKHKELSRSIERKELNNWWYDFNQKDLFSVIYDTKKIKALLDANIIFNLRDDSIVYDSLQDPRPLLSDWLIDEVDYYYAPEIYNEISRDTDDSRKEKTQRHLGKYIEARFDIEELKKIIKEKTSNNESDRKQLATCIVSNTSYFITMDKGILRKRDQIENTHDIQIFTPHEFVLEIDQLINKENYSPRKLAGVTFHTINNVTTSEINKYIDKFLFKERSEKKTDFKKIVYSQISSHNLNFKVIKLNNSPIAFFSYSYDDRVINVPFIRLSESDDKQTLFMQLISNIIDDAILHNSVNINIIEKYLSEEQCLILSHCGFEKDCHIWKKIIYNFIIDCNNISSVDINLKNIIEKLKIIKDVDERQRAFIKLERKYFPLKCSDLDIPCYIIPIRSYWASQLFDVNIAEGTLFGASPDKLWNIENVYYRSVRPVLETAPSRILWYVSSDNTINRSKAIVASSYLDEMQINKPKILFKRFKHYGIYDWKNICVL